MLHHILKQIWIQRKRNAWIFAELLVVFVLAWYIVDYGFVLLHNRLLDKGYQIDHTYRVAYKSTGEEDKEAFRIFYDRVRLFPGVEKAIVAGKYSGTTPFGQSYSGSMIGRDTIQSAQTFQVQVKPVSSNDYFDLFRIYSVLRPNSFGKLDFANEKSIVLTEDVAKALFNDETPVGKIVYLSNKEFRIVDVVNKQKNLDHERHSFVAFHPEYENNISDPEIAIRVGDNFSLDQFKKEVTSSVLTFDELRKKSDFFSGINNEIRIRFSLMAFFLINISLGIIGTFWFRNQTRRSEIGLRMALGSNKKQLQRQYLTEALLILTLAVIPGICINFALVQSGIINTVGDQYARSIQYITDNKWLRFLITNGITYVFLAVIVALSAWIPANRASKVHPVDALRDE